MGLRVREGPAWRAPLYPDLWKPKTIKGVPRDWALVSVIVGALFLGLSGNIGAMMGNKGIFGPLGQKLIGFGGFAVLWAIGWLAGKFDPEFFGVTLTRWQIGGTKTKAKGGGNEYFP